MSAAPGGPDPADMLGAVRRLPEDLAAGWRAWAGLRLPATWDPPDAVLLAGMGGSAIGGDLVAQLMADRLARPLVIARDYGLPAWVGPGTLVLASSHSGSTEETLAAFEAASAAGARRLAITSNGPLAARARATGTPLLRLPAGGQPRAALGYGLAALLAVLQAAGLLPSPAPAIEEAVALMRRAQAEDAAGGLVPTLVARLAGRLPVVVAPEGMAAVARRWKTQLNENAKLAAAWDSLPEMHHNSLVGLADPAGLNPMLHHLLLSAAGLPGPMARRLALTGELLAEHGAEASEVRAPAGGVFAQGLWLVQVGDLVSLRLAFHYGQDPTPVAILGRVKAALARPPGAVLDSPPGRG